MSKQTKVKNDGTICTSVFKSKTPEELTENFNYTLAKLICLRESDEVTTFYIKESNE